MKRLEKEVPKFLDKVRPQAYDDDEDEAPAKPDDKVPNEQKPAPPSDKPPQAGSQE